MPETEDGKSNLVDDLGEGILGVLPSSEMIPDQNGGRKVIVFCNAKGGVGKTTLCYEMARHLVALGQKPILMDLDYQCNLSAYAVGHKELYGRDRNMSLFRVFSGFPDDPSGHARSADFFNRAIRSAIGSGYGEEIPILLAHEDLIGVEAKMSRWYPAYLRYLPIPMFMRMNNGFETYTHVLIDCPPGLSRLTIGAVMAADLLIFPVSPDLLAMQGVRLLYRQTLAARDKLLLDSEHGEIARKFFKPIRAAVCMPRVKYAGAGGVSDSTRDAISLAIKIFDKTWVPIYPRDCDGAAKARAGLRSIRDGSSQGSAPQYRRELSDLLDGLLKLVG